MMIAELSPGFWGGALASTSILLFLYPYVIYPKLLSIIARKFPLPAAPSTTIANAELPTVALVICALNEANIIREKIENSLKLNYSAARLRIVVISDGSTDRTAAIVGEYVGKGVELIDCPVRRGKVANLNAILPTLQDEIVVLSDANVLYHPGAIHALVSCLADSAVGCASGKVVLTDNIGPLDSATGDYYSFEWQLQEDASRFYGMPGADGAMYAFRSGLFKPCPPDTIIEDFIIPLSIARRGLRIVFEPNAVGWEKGVTSLREEFRRKVRIAAGAMQGLLRGNAWPVGAGSRFWFVFVSHKLLRWMSPVTGLVAAVSTLWALRQWPMLVLVMSLTVTLIATIPLISKKAPPLLNAPFYFLFSQVAVGIGLIKGLFRLQTVLWAKADR